MWVFGVLGFYIMYRVIFRWYLVSLLKMGYNPGLAPVILLRPYFHYVIYSFAICLFAISTYCFYATNPWLVLLSPFLLLICSITHGAKTSSNLNSSISRAAKIQVSLEAQGVDQPQINSAVCLDLLGEDYGVGKDCDLKQLLKTYILPTLGLFTTIRAVARAGEFDAKALERYQKDSDEIDAITDSNLASIKNTTLDEISQK